MTLVSTGRDPLAGKVMTVINAQAEAVSRRGDPWPTIRTGLIIVALTFGGFGLWSVVTPLARGAHVTGRFAPEGNTQVVQHLEGGIIREIHVREGESVEKGQVLFQLDVTRSQSELDIFRNRLVEDQILEARLTSELAGKRAIELPADLARDSLPAWIKAAIVDQAALLKARQTETANRQDILKSRITQLDHQIQGTRGQMTSNRTQSRLVGEELQGIRQLAEKGLVPLPRVRALEREVARLEGEHSAMTSSVARAQVQIGETKMELLQATQTVEREALAQLNAVRARLNEIREQLKASADRVARAEIRSPLSGQAIDVKVHTVGGVISPGQALLTIVPEGSKLIVLAEVNPLDADVVHPGLPAEVRLSGLPRRTTPLLAGTVETFSTDTILDQKSGKSFYLARVVISPQELRKLRDVGIVPGMPVEVLIKAGERTALDYLISPWTDLFERAMREE